MSLICSSSSSSSPSFLGDDVVVGFVSSEPSVFRAIFSALSDTLVNGVIVLDENGMSISGLGSYKTCVMSVRITKFTEFRHGGRGPFQIPISFMPLKTWIPVNQKPVLFSMFMTKKSEKDNIVNFATTYPDGTTARILQLHLLNLDSDPSMPGYTDDDFDPKVIHIDWDQAFQIRKPVIENVVRASAKHGAEVYINYTKEEKKQDTNTRSNEERDQNTLTTSVKDDKAGGLSFKTYIAEHQSRTINWFQCYYPEYVQPISSTSPPAVPVATTTTAAADTNIHIEQEGQREDVSMKDSSSSSSPPSSRGESATSAAPSKFTKEEIESERDTTQIIKMLNASTSSTDECKKCFVLNPKRVDLPFYYPKNTEDDDSSTNAKDSPEQREGKEDSCEYEDDGHVHYSMTTLAIVTRLCAVSDEVILCRKARYDPGNGGYQPMALRFFVGDCGIVDCMISGRRDEESDNLFSYSSTMSNNSTDSLNQVRRLVTTSNELIESQRLRLATEQARQDAVEEAIDVSEKQVQQFRDAIHHRIEEEQEDTVETRTANIVYTDEDDVETGKQKKSTKRKSKPKTTTTTTTGTGSTAKPRKRKQSTNASSGNRTNKKSLPIKFTTIETDEPL